MPQPFLRYRRWRSTNAVLALMLGAGCSGAFSHSAAGVVPVAAATELGAAPAGPQSRPALLGVANFGTYRAWADGTFATSCKQYLEGTLGYGFTGDTANGVYRVQRPGSPPTDVFCRFP